MSTGLLDIIKRAALDATDASNPLSLVYGEVTKTAPLEIKVTDNFILPEEMLEIPHHLTDYQVEMSNSETSGVYTVFNSLQLGDRVAMLREQGGRIYFVLDKF